LNISLQVEGEELWYEDKIQIDDKKTSSGAGKCTEIQVVGARSKGIGRMPDVERVCEHEKVWSRMNV